MWLDDSKSLQFLKGLLCKDTVVAVVVYWLQMPVGQYNVFFSSSCIPLLFIITQ